MHVYIFHYILYSDAQTYAESQGAIFIESSAKSAINIAPLFIEISKILIDMSFIICARTPLTEVIRWGAGLA